MLSDVPDYATCVRTLKLPRVNGGCAVTTTSASQPVTPPVDHREAQQNSHSVRPERGGPLHKRFLLELQAITPDSEGACAHSAAAQLPRQQAAAQQLRLQERAEHGMRALRMPAAANRLLPQFLIDVGAVEVTSPALLFPLTKLPSCLDAKTDLQCPWAGRELIGHSTVAQSDNVGLNDALHSKRPDDIESNATAARVGSTSRMVVAHMQQPLHNAVCVPKGRGACNGVQQQQRQRMYGQKPREVVLAMMRQRGRCGS